MPVLVVSRNEAGSLPDISPDISRGGGFLRSHPEAVVDRSGKTFAVFKSNDNGRAGGTGFHA
jgi:hypothetical protein